MRPVQTSCGAVWSSLILLTLFILVLGIGGGSDAEETRALDETKVREKEMMDAGKLTEEEGKHLVETARKTIEKALFHPKNKSELDTMRFPKFQERRGTFVTITMNGALRGCIGTIIPQESLVESIRANAMNAAFRDPRFRPLSQGEFEKIKIEVSILTEPKPLAHTDANDLLAKLKPGTDGLILRKGYHQATFLPQVWEQLPNKKDFLTHLCLKAGLAGDAWVNEALDVYTYQVQAFEEE